MHTKCVGLWDRAQMASINDGVINASVYQCLIQMVPCDFELTSVLKKCGGSREVVVVEKREEPHAIFRGKIIFCGETMLANCALSIKKVTTNLNIKVPQNKRHITGKEGKD